MLLWDASRNFNFPESRLAKLALFQLALSWFCLKLMWALDRKKNLVALFQILQRSQLSCFSFSPVLPHYVSFINCKYIRLASPLVWVVAILYEALLQHGSYVDPKPEQIAVWEKSNLRRRGCLWKESSWVMPETALHWDAGASTTKRGTLDYICFAETTRSNELPNFGQDRDQGTSKNWGAKWELSPDSDGVSLNRKNQKCKRRFGYSKEELIGYGITHSEEKYSGKRITLRPARML